VPSLEAMFVPKPSVGVCKAGYLHAPGGSIDGFNPIAKNS
jgi:hypothetical protein